MKGYQKYFLPLKDKKEEKRLFNNLFKLCSDFYSGKTRNNKFLVYKSPDQLKQMVSEKLPLEGVGLEKMLKVMKNQIGKYSIAQFDKDYFAFPDSGNAIPALFADIYSKFLNQNLIAFSRSAPMATFIEIQLIEWLRELIGYDHKPLNNIMSLSEVSGMVTTGGHMSNHVAIMTALNETFPEIKRTGLSSLSFQPALVMAGDISHYSYTSAAHHLGIGQDGVLLSKSTSEYKTDIQDVEEILKDPPEGKKLFMVVGVAGNSRTTSLDDLERLADLCKKYKVWFHVDACHGGSLLFSDKYRQMLKGIEHADSVSLDPHKGLFSPYPLSFVIFKKRDALVNFTRYEDKVRQGFAWDLGYITPFYGSRGFESLKMWLMIKALGKKLIGKIVEDRQGLSFYCYELIKNSDYFCILNEMKFYRMTFVYYPSDIRRYVNSQTLTEEQKSSIKRIVDEFQLHDLGDFTGLGIKEKYVIMSVTVGNPEQSKKSIKNSLNKLFILSKREKPEFNRKINDIVKSGKVIKTETADKLYGPAGWK